MSRQHRVNLNRAFGLRALILSAFLSATAGAQTVQHWKGGTGTWSNTEPAWLNDGTPPLTTWAGGHGVFRDSSTETGGQININGVQGFQGLRFVDTGYWLQGAGALETSPGGSGIAVEAHETRIHTQITGVGSLSKTHDGTLLLTANNSYSGGTRLLGGVLSVSSDANLGDAGGGLEFDGGTLLITGSAFDRSARTITLGANGGGFDMAFNSDSDQTVTLVGNISGPGNLVKLGRGNLKLAGDNAYGDTIVREGELIGDSRSLSGNIHIADEDTAAITFVQTSDGTFSGNISGAPSAMVSASKEGAGTLTLAGVSTVNWLVEEGGLTTSASRFMGYATTGPDGVVTFHETADATLIGGVAGVGRINKTGGGALVLPGDNGAFIGHTTVSEGVLSVGGPEGTGRLGGTLAVQNGGTLTGSGQVGSSTVEAGGLMAPGNNFGTLHIAGDLTFEPGSTLEIEVNPDGSGSDQITVSGTANLQGGSVVHVGANGSYSPDTVHRILSADTALSGAFENVSSNLAFLTPSLAYDYDARTVDLHLQRNDSSFDSFAYTPNQRATASGLASLASDSALYQRVLNLGADEPAKVFDSLSGEVHASVVSALQASSHTVRTLPVSHLRTNLAAGLMPGAPLAQAGSGALPAGSMPRSAALPMWAEVVGSWRTMNDDGNAARLKQSTGGLFVGGDTYVGAGWRAGGALGYTDSKLRVNDRDSKADIQTYSAALYAGKAFELENGSLNLLLGGAYSRHSIDSRRHAAIADWNHTLKAHYHAHTTQLFGELGYAFDAGQITLEPFAGLAWADVRARGFNETGGPTALSARSQSQSNTTSTLGLRAGTAFQAGNTQGRVNATVAWRHAFGRLAAQRTLAFDTSQPFTVAGAPLARDAALLELSAEVAIAANATLGASYGAQLGGGMKEHVGRVDVRWRF